jgi:hypothetical protein
MADGWRRLLEEESEHQWLTLSLFGLFVLFGAFAIDATEHFVGDRITPITTELEGEGNTSYTSLVYTPNAGYHMFTEHVEDNTVMAIYSPETNDLGGQVNFLKTMPDGEILYSVAQNQLIGLKGNMMVTYDYSTGDENFAIHDVAESVGDTAQRMLLTHEGTDASFRGVSGMTPTEPMSTSSGVKWHHVEHHSEGLWMALGTHISTSGADGSSPATPQSRPVLGWITWPGDASTPVLRNVQMFGTGLFHSFAHSGDDVIVGGTVESLVVASDQTVVSLNAPAAKVVNDLDGTAWFIGPLGSTTLASYHGGVLEHHQLSRPVPVDVSDAGAQGDHVHVHGVDENGTPILWSIDITANGSIESGRGFLNLLFLLGGGVLLSMMAKHAIDQLRSSA